jgi:3-hydroxyisobutyrate dehydrogenase-like beta-hydroxyacid dehydrogenase
MTDESKLRIGFAGLGRMGAPMAANLAAADLLAGVYNRTPSKAEAFATTTGVTQFSSPARLAAESNVIITMVADEEASHSLFTQAEGLLGGLQPNTILIEMATVSVDHVKRVAALVDSEGCSLIDAPVSGSVAMAADGALAILASGDSMSLERVQPAFAVLGAQTFSLGGLGAGTAMKLAVQAVIYGLNQGVSEGLVLAERAGIAREVAYDVFASSAVAAPFVHYRRDLFERPDLAEPTFSLHLGVKDLRLILALAASLQVDLPQARTDLAVLDEAVGAGFAEHDVSAVAELLRGRYLQGSERVASTLQSVAVKSSFEPGQEEPNGSVG